MANAAAPPDTTVDPVQNDPIIQPAPLNFQDLLNSQKPPSTPDVVDSAAQKLISTSMKGPDGQPIQLVAPADQPQKPNFPLSKSSLPPAAPPESIIGSIVRQLTSTTPLTGDNKSSTGDSPDDSGPSPEASTPLAPIPTKSNPSSTNTPPTPATPPTPSAASIIASQVAQNPPQPRTDSAGYPDAPGDVAGKTYQEAQPVGVALWRDLPPATQQQIMAQNPGVPNVADMYDQQALRSQGNPMLMANSPDAAQTLARFGVQPTTGSVVSAAPALSAQARYFGSIYGNGQGGGSGRPGNMLTDAQGIPYAMLMPVPNPTTGAIEMKQVDIPKEARDSATPGVTQGEISDVTDLTKSFYDQALPKTFYGEIAPKYNSIVNLMNGLKAIPHDKNQFISMDMLNNYAGISRPGAVVRESTIGMDLAGSGVSNELVRKWSDFVTGTGTLSDKDLDQIQRAAEASYKGYAAQVERAKLPFMVTAHMRTGLSKDTLSQMMFPNEYNPDPNAQENLPAQGSDQSQAQPMYGRQKSTGAMVQSMDGGKTWQPASQSPQ